MKKILSVAIVLMMLLGLMIPVIASADTAVGTLWVNCADGKRLNVRAEPRKNSKLLYRVESGKSVTALATPVAVKGWTYVRQEGKAAGWVMTKFLQGNKPGKYEVTERSDNFVKVTAYTVTAKAINKNSDHSVGLRVKPNKTASAIRRLTAGDKLQVVAVGKTWSKVVDLATGRTGYVANDYIARV